jgi:hypothetical protein
MPVRKSEEGTSHLRTMRQFSGTRGERIEENTLVNPETLEPMSEQERQELGIEEPLVLYIGVVAVVNAVMQPMGPIGIPCDARFPIRDSSTPAEALANFDSAVQDFEDRMKQQQEAVEQKIREQQAQSELVVPNAAESEAINNLKLVTED